MPAQPTPTTTEQAQQAGLDDLVHNLSNALTPAFGVARLFELWGDEAANNLGELGELLDILVASLARARDDLAAARLCSTIWQGRAPAGEPPLTGRARELAVNLRSYATVLRRGLMEEQRIAEQVPPVLEQAAQLLEEQQRQLADEAHQRNLIARHYRRKAEQLGRAIDGDRPLPGRSVPSPELVAVEVLPRRESVSACNGGKR